MLWFFEMVYGAEYEMKGFLETLFEKGRFHHIYFIGEFALNQVSELRGYHGFELFANYHTGIHFGGKTIDNSLLSFDYMDYTEQSKGEKAGIGFLPNVTSESQAAKVVVPLARK